MLFLSCSAPRDPVHRHCHYFLTIVTVTRRCGGERAAQVGPQAAGLMQRRAGGLILRLATHVFAERPPARGIRALEHRLGRARAGQRPTRL